MTSILQAFKTAAISGAVLLYAASAAPQSVATAQGHEHRDAPAAGDKAAPSTSDRIAALDRRIQMLSTDVRMFSGEMKVEAMAALISTMLERQSLVESNMKSMRERMMRRMAERQLHAAPAESEPESMCAPSN
jgi:hypothetical protein